jgi:hypothetical protein
MADSDDTTAPMINDFNRAIIEEFRANGGPVRGPTDGDAHDH